MTGGWILLPREHGAWGLLLQPFVCAAVLGRRWDWLYLPAAALLLTAFAMREPLLIVARQKWIWRERKDEYAVARRCLLWQAPLCAILGCVCLAYLPAAPFLILAAVAVAVTALATWMALRNRQRSVALQIVSSAGLATTGLLASLVAARGLPAWAWPLYGLLVSHAVGSILIVRARLELRSGTKARSILRGAWACQIALTGAAAALWLGGQPGFAAATGVSVTAGVFELLRLRSPSALAEPLRRVGFRALAGSLVHSAVSVAVLW